MRVLLALSLAVIAGALLWGILRTLRRPDAGGDASLAASAPRPLDWPHSPPSTTLRPTDASGEVDSSAERRTPEAQVCAECHAEIVDQYRRSGMSRTWSLGTAALVAPRVTATGIVDDVTGYEYSIEFDGERLTQIETHSDHPGHALRRRADFVVGSGKHAQAVGRDENGYLTLLPAAWFSAESAWRLNPGYELKNHRFDRPITPGCVACHATDAEHRAPTTNRFRSPIAAGIECRRCHGAGESHVAFWRTNEANEPNASDRMIDPGDMAPDRALDLCLQCHLQGDVTLFEPNRDASQFKAGERLRDQRHDFLIARDDPAALGVASHGARLLRSRCFKSSDGRLTCLTCHDPHRPANDLSQREYDAKCATCHASESCSRPLDSHATGNSSSPGGSGDALETSCVACHMPQRSSREGIHLVFTDHAIVRRPRAVDTDVERDGAATETAVFVLPANSQFELVSCWPDDGPSDRLLGAANVIAHETMGPQLPALRRARQLLEREVERNPDDNESRFWLGAALLGLGKGQAAVARLREVVRRKPAHVAARFRLAAACELTGDFASAVAMYESLLRDAPDWSEPYPRLAQLYLYGQRPAAAVGLLERHLAWREDAASFAQLALAQGLSGMSQTRAMETLNRAIALDPQAPSTYVNRAALHLLASRPDLARADFEQVLRIDPLHAQAREALRRLTATPAEQAR